MTSEDPIRAHWKTFGLRVKRRNLFTAALSGSVLAWIALRWYPHSTAGLLLGFIGGLFYANAFEYCLHRFLLHRGGFFGHHHMIHHETLNAPEGPRYVNFSRNPLGVAALFLANGVPFLLLERFTRNAWVAGMFVSFAIYYIAFEEIHWRSHMGGRLPNWLRPAARHHLLHHAHDTDRFNVFFPLMDWLVGWLSPQQKILGGSVQK